MNKYQVGDYVKTPKNDHIHIVEAVNKYGSYMCNCTECDDCFQCGTPEPIPLTIDFFTSIGFVFYERHLDYGKKQVLIESATTGFVISVDPQPEGNKPVFRFTFSNNKHFTHSMQFDYVHEFQQFWRLFSDEEISLKK